MSRALDFRNALLSLTSIFGASIIENQPGLGLGPGDGEQTFERMREEPMNERRRHIRPGFLNRRDV